MIAWHLGCTTSRVMMTLTAHMLATVTGGNTNPAGLSTVGGCPALTAANNKKARAWLKANGITRDEGGNYTKKNDGKYPAIYRYEYANGSRCAPGADD